MPGMVPCCSRPVFYRQLTTEIMGSPSVSLLVPGLANYTLLVGCLSPYGLMKTPRELGAASSTHWHPYGLWKLSRYPWNQQGSGQATKIVKISIFTGHMGTFCESHMRVGHWQGVDLVPCDSPFHSKEPDSNAASFSQHLYDLFRAFRNFTWSIYTYCLFDAIKYVTIEAIDMKYEKGPVRSLKSMASSTCSCFALTIQLWGIEEGNVCIMIDILNGYAVQNA